MAAPCVPLEKILPLFLRLVALIEHFIHFDDPERRLGRRDALRIFRKQPLVGMDGGLVIHVFLAQFRYAPEHHGGVIDVADERKELDRVVHPVFFVKTDRDIIDGLVTQQRVHDLFLLVDLGHVEIQRHFFHQIFKNGYGLVVLVLHIIAPAKAVQGRNELRVIAKVKYFVVRFFGQFISGPALHFWVFEVVPRHVHVGLDIVLALRIIFCQVNEHRVRLVVLP